MFFSNSKRRHPYKSYMDVDTMRDFSKHVSYFHSNMFWGIPICKYGLQEIVCFYNKGELSVQFTIMCVMTYEFPW